MAFTDARQSGADVMEADMDQLAAIQRQVMWNRLIAVVEEQAQVMIRTAFSRPCVRQGIFPPGCSICRGA
jgi:N-methylhydantoinase B